MVNNRTMTYLASGVDTDQEETALKRLVSRIRPTWPTHHGIGTVQLPIGYFANVIDLGGGIGLAISADGVGTKVLIAQMLGKYDTMGIDCVAMNVNDLLCVGATPISMVDYLALQHPDPDMVDSLAKGLAAGAQLANISIAGGEMAQLRDIIKGYKEGLGFDLAGMAIGTVALDRIIIGQHIEEGDVIIGIESGGIHSNGFSLARRILFEEHTYPVDATFPNLEHPLGEELIKPTHIYVREVLEILNQGIPVKALIHITSDGLLNLTRVESKVSYVIEQLPPPPPIFSLIQDLGHVADEEMFRVYNMGIGFCIIVAATETERVLSVVRAHQKTAHRIGYAMVDERRQVVVKQKNLIGQGKRFRRAEA
jgi:phosphoribosylformylglycinamidine cyclo-ligase